MTKNKVSILTGAQLDYWVARADGRDAKLIDHGHGPICFASRIHDVYTGDTGPFCPSRSDADADPIINRENILFLNNCNHGIIAICKNSWEIAGNRRIAAMRAFVASKFGDELDLHKVG